jgi:hypothetical protein
MLVPARLGLRQPPTGVENTRGSSSVEEQIAKFMNNMASKERNN